MFPFNLLLAIVAVGALLCLALGRRSAANVIGPTACALGGAAGCWCGLAGMIGQGWDCRLPWSMPMGSFHVGMDPLSGLFVLVISLVGGLAGVFGGGYLAHWRSRKNLGLAWFAFLALLASMVLVVTARNGLLFLFAWEIMTLSSFFLVMFERDRDGVLEAGWTYLAASHLGTAFLFVLFLLLGRDGSLEFEAMSAGPGVAGAAFLLAVVGFGTKAGFLPLHVWLPEAHPAAPSHVSAVMSGVMIKTGIYGLLRMLAMLLESGPPPAWWGWTLVAVGAASAVLGVLFALAQHDLKRLLAYSSVENIGIIALGLGLGLLGVSHGRPIIATLAFSGAVLHVANHSLFKGLAFLGAGSVLHGAGVGRLDRLGGLLKRMPATGAAFAVASAAICGLPPLNGFVSEFLIYLASFRAVAKDAPGAIGGVVAIGSLALVGGLAAACFAKAFGVVFLGEPRSKQATEAREAGWLMRWPMLALAGLCVAVGLLGPLAIYAVQPTVAMLAGQMSPSAGELVPADVLWWISGAGVLLWALIVALAMGRRRLLRNRTVGRSLTWDCGYTLPAASMQYTGSSFALPIVHMFRLVLQPAERVDQPKGLFPTSASAATHVGDPFKDRLFGPIFRSVAWLAGRLHWMQQGRNQLYVLYIALAVLVLLVWWLGGKL